MELESVRKMWNDLWDCIKLPGMTRDSTQYLETRRAFYAGVFACLCQCRNAGTEATTEDEAVDYFESLYQECKSFQALVKAGKA